MPVFSYKQLDVAPVNRFPQWRPIEAPTFRFLQHQEYIDGANLFVAYDSNSWFSTLKVSFSSFSATPLVLVMLFTATLSELIFLEHVQRGGAATLSLAAILGGATSFLMVCRRAARYRRRNRRRCAGRGALGHSRFAPRRLAGLPDQ